MRAVRCLVLGLFVLTSANAQSSGTPFAIAPVSKGLVVGVIVGVVVVGVGAAFLAYYVLHNRGVAVGCIAEAGGKTTLVLSDKRVYSLLATGPPLPVGERVKLKCHKSGPASAPLFQVEKVLKDYGPCKP